MINVGKVIKEVEKLCYNKMEKNDYNVGRVASAILLPPDPSTNVTDDATDGPANSFAASVFLLSTSYLLCTKVV